MLVGRALPGFAHAYINDEIARAVLLVVLSVLTLISAARYAYAFTVNDTRRCVCSLLARTLLGVVLPVELWLDFDSALISPKEAVAGGICCFIIYSILLKILTVFALKNSSKPTTVCDTTSAVGGGCYTHSFRDGNIDVG